MSVLAANIRAEIRLIASTYRLLRTYGYVVADVPFNDAKFDEPDDEFVMQVLRALEWLKDLPKTTRYNRTTTSYGYKHEAERLHHGFGAGGNYYISNGAFIVAALIAGFKVKRCGGFHNPNVYLNIGVRKTKRPAPAPVTEPNRSPIFRPLPVQVGR